MKQRRMKRMGKGRQRREHEARNDKEIYIKKKLALDITKLRKQREEKRARKRDNRRSQEGREGMKESFFTFLSSPLIKTENYGPSGHQCTPFLFLISGQQVKLQSPASQCLPKLALDSPLHVISHLVCLSSLVANRQETKYLSLVNYYFVWSSLIMSWLRCIKSFFNFYLSFFYLFNLFPPFTFSFSTCFYCYLSCSTFVFFFNPFFLPFFYLIISRFTNTYVRNKPHIKSRLQLKYVKK